MVHIERLSCGSHRITADVGISDLDWESDTEAEHRGEDAGFPLLVELARRPDEFSGGPSTVSLGTASYGGYSNLFVTAELSESDLVSLSTCSRKKSACRLKISCTIPAGESRAVGNVEIG